MKTLYNLPKKIIFCRICVTPNQYPTSIPEFKHTKERKNARYINFNKYNICDACIHAENKKKIDWKNREIKLLRLLDKYRKNNGDFDCIVPGSGGKDSAYQSHVLKYKYGMNPLTVTWPPILYTKYGKRNFINWIRLGKFINISYKPKIKVSKILTRLSILNLLHPFQTFILGQKNFAPHIALKHNIKLIFYGENESEYGNPIADNSTSLRDKSFFTSENLNNTFLAGVKTKHLIKKFDLKMSDLKIYLPINSEEYVKSGIKIHYLGYYLKWVPQEAYYYAVENTGFKARPHKTEGTYSKYNSIDDKIDDLHYYTRYIKFGFGRCTQEASQEIRNNHINREEAKALVKKFDGEFPSRYFNEIMDYLEIRPKSFIKLLDKFRSPHIWRKEKNEWKLRHTVNRDGADD